MAGHIGNQNAKGNSGGKKGRSGRKSAYAERADADFLWKMFTEEMDRDELIKNLAKKKHSIFQAMLAKAMQGNEQFILAMFKKLFPDNLNIQANLQQKRVETLETNVRELLTLGAEIARAQTKKTSSAKIDIADKIKEATAAITKKKAATRKVKKKTTKKIAKKKKA